MDVVKRFFTTKVSVDMNSTPIPRFNSYTFLPIRKSSDIRQRSFLEFLSNDTSIIFF